MKLKDEQQKYFLELVENLLKANEEDSLSSQITKDLIKKNISALKEELLTGETLTPSEYGKPLTLGLGKNIGEFRVSEKVLDWAYEIDRYFDTL